MPKVIILTGMPGAGKEEFVQVALENGYNIIRMGDVVREEAKRRGTAMDDRGVGGFANQERESHGPGIWAERCLQALDEGDTVIDGSRSLIELEVFRRLLGGDLRLVAIHSSPQQRFLRLQRRGRYDAPPDHEAFKERDRRELGWGLGSLIAMADVMLVNEGTLEQFRRYATEELRRIW
ncbi:MAG: AAA family ATPase [Methanomassiliicoccus sp.]|nr:AAA family ATPase [Methanomassiliicoccus sp.]